MIDINKVILIGRLTRNTELKYTRDGKPYIDFSIACNERRKDGDAWSYAASFFDIAFFDKRAESLNRFMTKGKQVCIEGRLRQETWKDRDNGQPREKVKIIAKEIQLIGPKFEDDKEIQLIGPKFEDDINF